MFSLPQHIIGTHPTRLSMIRRVSGFYPELWYKNLSAPVSRCVHRNLCNTSCLQVPKTHLVFPHEISCPCALLINTVHSRTARVFFFLGTICLFFFIIAQEICSLTPSICPGRGRRDKTNWFATDFKMQCVCQCVFMQRLEVCHLMH